MNFPKGTCSSGRARCAGIFSISKRDWRVSFTISECGRALQRVDAQLSQYFSKGQAGPYCLLPWDHAGDTEQDQGGEVSDEKVRMWKLGNVKMWK